ncbi:hypothetical protein [Salininema proteolyticum]|uniref:Uncharacterized protein n=1 Tax=Salininema proteolyticum TaxID=1607685 RepID=A0ABV8TZW9_9ACTN
MTTEQTAPERRPTLVRKAAGYFAAATLSLYLALKIYWVVAGLLGSGIPGATTAADWILLNAVTVGMAALGVGIALALAQDWGRRLPGWAVVFVSWTAAGFLVSILPAHAVRALLPDKGDPGDIVAAIPEWEMVLVAIAFIGMGIGIAIAGPLYLRERWPHAFTGRVRDHGPLRTPAAAGIPLALATAATVLYWTLGGGLWRDDLYNGADPGTATLFATEAAWAVTAAVCALILLRGRARTPVWLPMALLWIGSGSLFTWNSWRLFIGTAFAPDSDGLSRHLPAILAETCGAVAGALLFATALAVHRARSRLL